MTPKEQIIQRFREIITEAEANRSNYDCHRISLNKYEAIRNNLIMKFSSELDELERKVREEERERIKENIVQFAIEGKFEADEMKGLALYTKIMSYFHSLLASPKEEDRWLCGKCDIEAGKYPDAEPIPEHSLHCPKRFSPKEEKEECSCHCHAHINDSDCIQEGWSCPHCTDAVISQDAVCTIHGREGCNHGVKEGDMKITPKEIQNAASNLLNRHGLTIRKHDVRIAVILNEATKDLYWQEKERIINAIWRKIGSQK